MARQPTNLWRRSNVFYLRMRVPADIVEAFGKEFIVQSLRTSDRREAIQRLRIAQGEVQKQFDNLRNQQRVPSRVDRLLRRGEIGKLSSAEIEGIVRHWFAAELERANDTLDLPKDPDEIEAALEDIDEHFALLRSPQTNDSADMVGDAVRRLLIEMGAPTSTAAGPIGPTRLDLHPVSIDASAPQFRELRALVRRGQVILNRVRRAHIEPATSIPSDPILMARRPNVPVEAQGATLDQLIKEFERDPSRPAMTEKTRRDYGMVFRVLREVIGSDTPVRSISRREHCIPVRDLLQRLPPHSTKKFPGKTLEYAAEQRAKLDLPHLNHQTINSHLNKNEHALQLVRKRGTDG